LRRTMATKPGGGGVVVVCPLITPSSLATMAAHALSGIKGEPDRAEINDIQQIWQF
jgi:hypothetical protein